ncbi:MAG: hypothetical protein IPM93_13050 [Candidatus Obscuribacter sp.]|nr:hypothetical protein [Candidatus Obscuribacter sp.]
MMQNQTKMKMRPVQNQRGQMTIVMGLAAFLAALLCISAAIDGAHVYLVQQELIRVTDSAALAGAARLTGESATVISAVSDVAAANRVDGKPIIDNPPRTTLAVTINNPAGQNQGTVTVATSTTTRHIFMPLLGRHEDHVYAQSTAGAGAPVTALARNKVFPLAVSYDAKPSDDPQARALKDLQLGDITTLYLSSQQFKNAAFTSLGPESTSASAVKSLIDGHLKQSNTEESVQVGDSIDMGNGVMGLKYLANSPYREILLGKECLFLPIISGQPAFNESQNVLGFVAVKILEIQKHGDGGSNLLFTVKLVPGLTEGLSQESSNSPSQLAAISLRSVRLLR